jgi:hypothetical protein
MTPYSGRCLFGGLTNCAFNPERTRSKPQTPGAPPRSKKKEVGRPSLNHIWEYDLASRRLGEQDTVETLIWPGSE